MTIVNTKVNTKVSTLTKLVQQGSKLNPFEGTLIIANESGAEEEKIVILNFHRGENKFSKAANDIYFENNCKTDFSDVKITDANGNEIPLKILASGNYDIVTDSDLPKDTLIHQLSDGRLVYSLNNTIYASLDGKTWEVIATDAGNGVFVAQNDVLIAHKNNIVYRSVAPYSTWTPVLDFSAIDAGDGVYVYMGIGQLDSGEIIIGRYQLANSVKIFKSTDEGLTFTLAYSNTTNQHVHNIHIDRSTTPNTIYAGLDAGAGDYTVLKSTDIGVTWVALENVPRAKDYGVIYSESGYRLIGGETNIVGGASIIKTTDDVNFSTVLKNGHGVYRVRKLNSSLYGIYVSARDWQSTGVVRSSDNGETWEMIFITDNLEEGGASDGFRYMSEVISIGGVDQLLLGPQSSVYNSLRIFDGGNNYHALATIKVTVPVGGLSLNIKSRGSDISEANLYIEDRNDNALIYLPMNEGEGTVIKEYVADENISVTNPNWGSGLKRTYDFYPAIQAASEQYSLLFSSDLVINKTFMTDLSGGNWTMMFWMKENPDVDYAAEVFDTLIGFSNSDSNLAIRTGLGLRQGYGGVNFLTFSSRAYGFFIALVCNAEGVTANYVNGILKTTNSLNLSIMKDGFQIGQYYNIPTLRPFRHYLSHFQIISGQLTADEIAALYGNGKVTDLI